MERGQILARFSFGQALHKLAKTDSASQSSKKGGGLLNPWPGYNFTGRLRPAAQVGIPVSKGQGHGSCLQSSKRVVPDHIPRPDYADHPEGYPMSEMKLKGNTYIRSGHANYIVPDVQFKVLGWGGVGRP